MYNCLINYFSTRYTLFIVCHVQCVRFAQIIGKPVNYVIFAHKVQTTTLLYCVVKDILVMPYRNVQ